MTKVQPLIAALFVGLLLSVWCAAQVRREYGPATIAPPAFGDSKPAGKPAPHWVLGQAEAMYLEEDDSTRVYLVNVYLKRTKTVSVHMGFQYSVKGLRLVEPESIEFLLFAIARRSLLEGGPPVVVVIDGKKIPLSGKAYDAGTPDDGTYYDQATFDMPWSVVCELAKAKQASIVVGAITYPVAARELRMIRDLRAFGSNKVLRVD